LSIITPAIKSLKVVIPAPEVGALSVQSAPACRQAGRESFRKDSGQAGMTEIWTCGSQK